MILQSMPLILQHTITTKKQSHEKVRKFYLQSESESRCNLHLPDRHDGSGFTAAQPAVMRIYFCLPNFADFGLNAIVTMQPSDS